MINESLDDLVKRQFKVGDVVTLNSGGPPMTVNEWNERKEKWECEWFDDSVSACGWRESKGFFADAALLECDTTKTP